MRIKLWLSAFFVVMLLAGVASAESQALYHDVKKGDTLWGLARRYKVSQQEIRSANPKGIGKKDIIRIDSQLVIPTETVVAVAQRKSDETIIETGDKKVKAQKPVSVKAEVSKAKTLKTTPKKVSAEAQSVSRYIILNKDWEDPGANKYKGILSEDLLILGYTQEEANGFQRSIGNSDFIRAIIKPKSKGGLVVDTEGNEYTIVKMLSGGGKGRPVEIFTGLNNEQVFLNNKKIPSSHETGRIYSSGNGAFILFPYKCDNPTKIILVKSPPPSFEPTPSAPPIEMIIPPIAKAPPEKWSRTSPDNWDWYAGWGNYQNKKEGDDNHGHYEWTKLRYRPLWYKPDKNSLGIKNVGFGFVGFLAGGEGIAAKHYDYSWSEAALGLTTKVYAEHSDYDFDLMAGRLWNKGGWMGTEVNRQVDDFLLVSAHGNFYRDGDAEIFHKFELNIEGRFPFHTEVEKGTKSNNRVVELTYLQWIKKFDILGDYSVVFSSGITIAPGYEWGAEDKSYLKVGPSFEIASYNNVIAGFSLWNYKFQGDGQWQPISGYVSIDGAWRAYEASQITSISEEDLRGLENGSKPLANPTDYLE